MKNDTNSANNISLKAAKKYFAHEVRNINQSESYHKCKNQYSLIICDRLNLGYHNAIAQLTLNIPEIFIKGS